ncbi:MAG TPA: thiolase family protein [Gaiellaceae bacterium]|jgi:acetyl-CoA C-acetyltransferase|nr:thiolase family protein [Gaiellaceae bacterium]
MRFEDSWIPVSASWSSPFVRWQGPAADISSLDLALQVTRDGLARSGVEWPVSELVLGITVPQKESFYGAPTLAARLGLGHTSGPMLAQACATSVACIHWAAANGRGARLVVATDRTSNGPHLVYPRTGAPGSTPDSENWVLDNFGRDPVTGKAMLATAERVAAEGKIEKAELDDLAVRRYEQYLDALADDRAFQREWMVPIAAGSRRKPLELAEDWGIRPVVREELEALGPVEEGGVVSYGTQTHPADGCAGMIVADKETLGGHDGPVARIRSTGFARVEPGTMPKAPVPAARAALEDAGMGIGDVAVIKTHNPFAVNDVWFARELGVDANELNPFGSSLVYGHPQAPTGARGVVELMHALVRRGGGIGLFTGCAAGDTGAALVLEVDG